MNQQNLADFIWNVADTLHGDFKQSEFGRIILLFTVLRPLECVLEPTRAAVLEQFQALKDSGVDLDLVLPSTAQASFCNVSQFSLSSVGSTSTRANLEDYIAKISAIDLHPDAISNHEMGLVFSTDHDALNGEGVVRTVYDCACRMPGSTRANAMTKTAKSVSSATKLTSIVTFSIPPVAQTARHRRRLKNGRSGNRRAVE